MKIGMLLFENLTQLDLTGPYEVFNKIPDVQIFLISEKIEPIRSDGGLCIISDTTLADCPQLDIIFVPGGPGVLAAIENPTIISFLKQQAEKAQYITSVCTGALVLAAADLLRGYHATTHWLSLDLLALFKNIKVEDKRVVIDRNRITGGGVTAGIDFGLTLVAHIYGEDLAKEIQLMLEYNPLPPFNSGSPQTADSHIIEKIKSQRASIQNQRKERIMKLIS